MIKQAILNPLAASPAKAGRSVLAVAPQSAKAFSEEFGSALLNMSRSERKTPVEHRNNAADSSALRNANTNQAGADRAGSSALTRQPKERDQHTPVQHDVAGRPQSAEVKSNKSQPKPTAKQTETAGNELEAQAVEPQADQPDTPPADQAVDALKSLLTMGALTTAEGSTLAVPAEEALTNTSLEIADTGIEPSASTGEGLALIESAQPQVDQVKPVEMAEAIISTPADTALVEANAQVTAENIIANLGEPTTNEGEPATNEREDQPETEPQLTSAVGAMAASVQPTQATNPATASDAASTATASTAEITQANAISTEEPAATITATSQGDTSETTQPAKAEQATNEQATNEPATPTAQANKTEGSTAPVAEAIQANTNQNPEGDTPADQGENPLPQQAQPNTSTASAKADATTPQPLIGGVQAPGQAASITGTSPASQAQQAGQPQQPQTLTPAQQMASALGALRRRGDGSYMTEITLNPKELGQVRLQVQVVGNTVSMQATALDPTTRALLNTGLEELSQALTDAGLESGQLDVNQGDSNDNSADDQPFSGFGAAGVQVIDEEELTSTAASADYITSTSVNTLA